MVESVNLINATRINDMNTTMTSMSIESVVTQPFGRWQKDQVVWVQAISKTGVATVSEHPRVISEGVGEIPQEYLQPIIPSPVKDLRIENHGSICLFRPLTEAACGWLKEHCDSDEHQYFGSALVVEPRYVEDLAENAVNDGLTL